MNVTFVEKVFVSKIKDLEMKKSQIIKWGPNLKDKCPSEPQGGSGKQKGRQQYKDEGRLWGDGITSEGRQRQETPKAGSGFEGVSPRAF